MSKPLVSVIIPVYKVEKYLDECVRSVMSQTYKKLQIILVNDGSPDNCPAMCEAYKTMDDRIVVVHKENGGLGSARNVGVDTANGKYIEFLDSDDWILPETIEVCVNEAEKNNLDILLFSARSFTEDINSIEPKLMNMYTRSVRLNEILQGAKCYTSTKDAGEYFSSVCIRLYNTDFWRNYRFQDGILHEDEDVGFLSLVQAKRVEIIDRRFYQRRYHSGSIMTSKSNISSAEGYACAFESLAKVYSEYGEHRDLFARQMQEYLKTVLVMYEKTEDKGSFKNKVQVHLRSGLNTGIKFPKQQRRAMKSLLLWKIAEKTNKKLYALRVLIGKAYHSLRKVLYS